MLNPVDTGSFAVYLESRVFVPGSCPYCGEEVEVDVDESGGSRQSYVQDCPICCQPWQVDVERDREGDWEARLRSGDD